MRRHAYSVRILPLPVGRSGCGKFADMTDDAVNQSFKTVNCTSSQAKTSEPIYAEGRLLRAPRLVL